MTRKNRPNENPGEEHFKAKTCTKGPALGCAWRVPRSEGKQVWMACYKREVVANRVGKVCGWHSQTAFEAE